MTRPDSREVLKQLLADLDQRSVGASGDRVILDFATRHDRGPTLSDLRAALDVEEVVVARGELLDGEVYRDRSPDDEYTFVTLHGNAYRASLPLDGRRVEVVLRPCEEAPDAS